MTKIINDTDNELKKLRTVESWAKLDKEIVKMTSDVGIGMKTKKEFYTENVFFIKIIAMSGVHKNQILTKLKRDAIFKVIYALRLQINEKSHADNLNIMKECLYFAIKIYFKNCI